MADEKQEVEEITAICSGLNINIGTLNENTIPAMFLAGKKAQMLKHPLVLDPVGVGASKLRTDTALQLLDEIDFSVVRGNISEIKVLALGVGSTKGVDADIADRITEENLADVVAFAKNYARKIGAVVAITGAIDVVANDSCAYVIRNGVSMMAKITGSGCMLSAMIAAYIAANQENILQATAAAVCVMGLCGENAYARMIERKEGNSSFRNHLIDAVCNLTADELERGAKYEVY